MYVVFTFIIHYFTKCRAQFFNNLYDIQYKGSTCTKITTRHPDQGMWKQLPRLFDDWRLWNKACNDLFNGGWEKIMTYRWMRNRMISFTDCSADFNNFSMYKDFNFSEFIRSQMFSKQSVQICYSVNTQDYLLN